MTKSPSPIPVTSRTRLQLWNGNQALEKVRIFVNGPVNVDWTRKDLTWWFQFTTSAAGFAGHARWELSRTPFVEWADWKPTDGYGFEGVADATKFFIGLEPYAPIPGFLATTAKVPGPPQAGMQPKPANASPASDIPGQFTPPQPGVRGLPAKEAGKPVLPAAQGEAVVAGQGLVNLPALRSLYVRVVPLDSTGADADLPSNFVELRFGPAEKAPPFKLDPAVWPQITFLPYEYRPVQAYTSDWQCWVKATQDIPGGSMLGAMTKGSSLNTCAHDDGPIDQFFETMGGFIGLLKSFVNGVSAAFDSIKSFATSTIAGALGCSGKPMCESLISAGLNAGLIALGMPPDLPDFNALQSMGEDYLAETIAQQVAAQTGVPFADEATKQAVKEMIDKGTQAAESGGGGSSMFWIPDDARQYKPLLVMVSASNTGAANTAAMYLEITETGTRYKGATLLIPSLQPNQSFKVGVALKPTKDPKGWMELLPTKEDYESMLLGTAVTKLQQAEAALKAWRSEYLSGMVTFRARLILSPFDKQVFERSCMADKPQCLVQ